MSLKIKVLGCSLFLCLLSLSVRALINPNFTPIHLVDQSSDIQIIDFSAIDKEQKVVCKVAKSLKGKSTVKEFIIDLSKAPGPSHTKAMTELIDASKGRSAVFLIGKFNDSEDASGKAKAFLHVSGKWIVLSEGEGAWVPNSISSKMEGTWAGGTDMLAQAIEYILVDSSPSVPTNSSVSWEEPVDVMTISGVISSASSVDLKGDGKLYLFVASNEGDKLLFNDGEDFKDVTEDKKLTSSSAKHVWMDLDNDGLLDLVSFDSKKVSFYKQNADGGFEDGKSDVLTGLPNSCLGMFSINSKEKGKAGLLIATNDGPVLFTSGKFPMAAEKIGGDVKYNASLGKAGTCLVADFDNDGHVDILQLFEAGSMAFKGKGSGSFEAPKACSVALGKKASVAILGDYNANGLFDIFTSADNGNQIWQNEGEFVFSGTITISGEISYISKSGGIAATNCDVNNDGRQDIFVAYSDYSPQIFFNRGFRSFGHAHMLDLAEKNLLPRSGEGLQAACVADFNHDGAQDLITILKTGEVSYFMRESEEEDSLVVNVDVSLKGANKGPVSVSGWVEFGNKGKSRCLGSWNVTAGSSVGFIGLFEPGPVEIKWTLPGGEKKSKKIEIEDKPIRLTIE